MNREQCVGCAYFLAGRAANEAQNSERFCHYLLYTQKRRQVGENEICLSRREKQIKVPNHYGLG